MKKLLWAVVLVGTVAAGVPWLLPGFFHKTALMDSNTIDQDIVILRPAPLSFELDAGAHAALWGLEPEAQKEPEDNKKDVESIGDWQVIPQAVGWLLERSDPDLRYLFQGVIASAAGFKAVLRRSDADDPWLLLARGDWLETLQVQEVGPQGMLLLEPGGQSYYLGLFYLKKEPE